jgi:hypothetical protein
MVQNVKSIYILLIKIKIVKIKLTIVLNVIELFIEIV